MVMEWGYLAAHSEKRGRLIHQIAHILHKRLAAMLHCKHFKNLHVGQLSLELALNKFTEFQ